jgi:hypothetical protein
MIYTTWTALAKATWYKEARVRVMIKDWRVKTIKNQYWNIVWYIILEKFLKDIL